MAINALVCYISKNKKNKMFIILSMTQPHTHRALGGTAQRSFSCFVLTPGDISSKGQDISVKANKQGPRSSASWNGIFSI